MSNKKLTYLLVGEPNMSVDAIYMLKLYDENAVNKDGDRDVLRYSKNHRTHAWADEQSDKFPAITGFAKFEGMADENYLSFVFDSSDRAMKDFFNYSSHNVKNGGNLFKLYDPQEEKEEYLNEYEREDFVREEVRSMTIAEMSAINISLGAGYEEGVTLKGAKADLARNIYEDIEAVAEAIKDESLIYAYYATKALHHKIIVVDNGTINYGTNQIGSVSLGDNPVDAVAEKMMTNKDFSAKLISALKKKK